MAYRLTVIVSVIVAFVLQGCSPRKTASIDRDLRGTLQNSSFQTVHSTTNLPQRIVDLCADGNGKLANPSQDWESTDLIQDPSLPRNRLIWAAVSGRTYVVHYEQGGRGHHLHLLAATLVSSNATEEARWTWLGEPFQDFAAFQTAFKSSSLDKNFN